MRLPFAASIHALVHPGRAFVKPPPKLGRALRDMALVWMPLALANTAWTARRLVHAYEDLRTGNGCTSILGRLGVDPMDIHDLMATLPPPPAWGRIWPWLLLVVPLGVLGTWLHHSVWDHMSLLLLGGLRQRRGFRTTLLAEAEALRIAALGTLVGFLGYLPPLGLALVLPLFLLDAYLWLFRGYAMAARHGCETWRGVAATVVHAVLLGCLALGFFMLLVVLMRASG
jgi:hypothetical protein